MTIRTRFAPSPTGFMHLGNARTAMFCWLFAKHQQGKFVLRIEDTDVERSTAAAKQVILESLTWLGLDCDEGPFYQSQRLPRYREVVAKLLAEGKAYRCYCSKERLAELRHQQTEQKLKPRYDGCCRDKNLTDTNTPHVIRFKNPQQGEIKFTDLVRGEVIVQNSELDDLIIVRSDGSPTYNFCVVVDDLDMQISHVLRGADHINNTPRQINIFHALDAVPPTYAHMPLILGSDGSLLSKRHGAKSVLEYRDAGFLKEALLNCLVRLGWSHGDQELFSVDEMIEWFDVKKLNKAAAAFNPDKLLWLNKHYLKTLSAAVIAERLTPFVKELNLQQGPDLAEVVAVQAERCDTLLEMAEKSKFFYEDVKQYTDKAQKFLKSENTAIVTELRRRFAELHTWQRELLHEIIVAVAEQFELKLGKVAQPLRVAVTGSTISPPMDVTLQLLGKEQVLARLELFLAKIS